MDLISGELAAAAGTGVGRLAARQPARPPTGLSMNRFSRVSRRIALLDERYPQPVTSELWSI